MILTISEIELLSNFVGEPLYTKKQLHLKQQWKFHWCDGFYPTVDTAKFSESWDWVMPVVIKCDKVAYKIANGPQAYIKVELALKKLDKSNILIECIKFIKLYNASNSILKDKEK